MNESLRLAAWLEAHAKYMHVDEQPEMMKAARLIRLLEADVNLMRDGLLRAQKAVQEIKGMVNELSQQEDPGSSPGKPVSALWR